MEPTALVELAPCQSTSSSALTLCLLNLRSWNTPLVLSLDQNTEHAVITSHCCQTMDDVDTKILALSALTLFLWEEESRKRRIRRKVRRTKWVKLWIQLRAGQGAYPNLFYCLIFIYRFIVKHL